MTAAEILEQIRGLPERERDELVERIEIEYGDFDDKLTPEQLAELERRAEDFRKNPQAGIPWEQVRDGARKRFGWK